jgi:hypothetical protein
MDGTPKLLRTRTTSPRPPGAERVTLSGGHMIHDESLEKYFETAPRSSTSMDSR